MPSALRLMAILAHPDDESLGVGGVLSKYSAEGIDVSLLTATRGERGRFHGHRPGEPPHPGPDELGRIREGELREAARVLGVGDLALLDYKDQDLDRAPAGEAIALIAGHIRRVRPHVVVTFGPDGAYGHPDHIAISQFTTAAIVAAADAGFRTPSHADAAAHVVAKLYYIAWDERPWAGYQEAFRQVTSTVDGVVRHVAPWPSWSLTTVVDTAESWPIVWRAVQCHASQISAYERLAALTPERHRDLWGWQSFYRASSLVNGGRRRESDLFEGLR
jgi:LmbE family N-acetylglucosaminyl deacetylase